MGEKASSFPLKQKGMWSQPRLWESRGPEQEVTGNAMTRKKQAWLSPHFYWKYTQLVVCLVKEILTQPTGSPFTRSEFWNLCWDFGICTGENSRADQSGREGKKLLWPGPALLRDRVCALSRD